MRYQITSTTYIIFYALFLLLIIPSQAHAQKQSHIKMPPSFNLNSNPVDVLNNYPLGKLSRDVTFSHHGKEHLSVTLPNGLLGLVYNVGKAETHRTYTLMLDRNNIVIDVIYFDHGIYEKTGLSALSLQSDILREIK